jgi:hypothetical protein
LFCARIKLIFLIDSIFSLSLELWTDYAISSGILKAQWAFNARAQQ